MGDEQVIGVIRDVHHALSGAAVLGPQRLEFVVDLAPCGVVLDLVPDGKCGAHVVSPLGSGGCLPPGWQPTAPLLPSQDVRLGNIYLIIETLSRSGSCARTTSPAACHLSHGQRMRPARPAHHPANCGPGWPPARRLMFALHAWSLHAGAPNGSPGSASCNGGGRGAGRAHSPRGEPPVPDVAVSCPPRSGPAYS
jgi:hypothetical protein